MSFLLEDLNQSFDQDIDEQGIGHQQGPFRFDVLKLRRRKVSVDDAFEQYELKTDMMLTTYERWGIASETSTSTGFKGFSSGLNFTSTVMALVTWGLAVYLADGLLRLSSFTSGLLAFLVGVLTHHWFWLHGVKLTRKEMVFFDEANLLETSNLFEFSHVPCTEGTTPISGPEKFPDAPTTLWQALFCDDKQLQIQKFYKEHYGPVWETAKRREQEWKAIQEAQKLTKTGNEPKPKQKISKAGNESKQKPSKAGNEAKQKVPKVNSEKKKLTKSK